MTSYRVWYDNDGLSFTIEGASSVDAAEQFALINPPAKIGNDSRTVIVSVIEIEKAIFRAPKVFFPEDQFGYQKHKIAAVITIDAYTGTMRFWLDEIDTATLRDIREGNVMLCRRDVVEDLMTRGLCYPGGLTRKGILYLHHFERMYGQLEVYRSTSDNLVYMAVSLADILCIQAVAPAPEPYDPAKMEFERLNDDEYVEFWSIPGIHDEYARVLQVGRYASNLNLYSATVYDLRRHAQRGLLGFYEL